MKTIIALLVVIVIMAGYTMVLDIRTSAQVEVHGQVLQTVVDELYLAKAQIQMLEERLAFQSKMVVPMWLYFDHKPKVRIPKRPRSRPSDISRGT